MKTLLTKNLRYQRKNSNPSQGIYLVYKSNRVLFYLKTQLGIFSKFQRRKIQKLSRNLQNLKQFLERFFLKSSQNLGISKRFQKYREEVTYVQS